MSSHNLDLSSMVPSNMPYPVHRIKIRYGINLKGKADSFGICITSRVKIIKPIINHRDPYSSFFIIYSPTTLEIFADYSTTLAASNTS